VGCSGTFSGREGEDSESGCVAGWRSLDKKKCKVSWLLDWMLGWLGGCTVVWSGDGDRDLISCYMSDLL
jgi:hypothetical protein